MKEQVIIITLEEYKALKDTIICLLELQQDYKFLLDFYNRCHQPILVKEKRKIGFDCEKKI
jgi:PHD/YefM family antitoxin component YafN of YafNO toxin-antitoxin module